MNKEELKEIATLQKEVKQLQDKLAELQCGDGDNDIIVSDKVRGSMSQFPFSARSFNLVGREQMSEECIKERTEIAKKLSNKYSELSHRINKALDYINTISDSEIRTIYRYRFIDGREWKEIGLYMNYDESTVRRKCRVWEKKNK